MKEYEYLKRLGKCISNGSVRGEILDEYKAHLEDCREALMKNGMSKAEAEEEAVRQMGNPEEVGVMDVMKPDYGEAVDIYEGEIPVFWPCGVTPQAAIENAKLPIVITHAPGHMFITDILNSELNDYLEAQKNK